MPNQPSKKSVDERVYERTKGADEGTAVVYDNQPEAQQQSPNQPVTQGRQDKASADSFPASDPPATSVPTTSTTCKE
jgi:hypothetical protein